MLKTINIDLEYQPRIDGPPVSPQELQKQAATGDAQTVDHWRKIWIDNYKSAKDHFGSFAEKSFGQLYGINRHKPAIVIGSGPSLKDAVPALKENSEMRNPLMTVSCLHNFGFFEDQGFHADYYLSLDAGSVVIDDVSESHEKDGDYYWEQTKGKKLLAYIASDPKLWEKWQGEVYLFNSLIPDLSVRNAFNEVEQMDHYVSSGGNALGAAMYTARAVFSSGSIIYVGADFCFSYDNQFHPWKSQYDKQGNIVRWHDVYGIMRKTWPSYLNFKCWLDKVACTVPCDWISASEGILGAYKEGNIKQFRYMPLEHAIYPYKCAEVVEEQEIKRSADGKEEVVGKNSLHLDEYFKNTKQDRPITLF